MCVGKCARCTGLSLMLLAMLSVTANLFLLFPNLDGSYLRRRQISSYARFLSGVWAGGFMVLLASIQITTTGFKMKRLSCCGPRCDMLLSGIFSFVALLGAAISLLISVAGLFSGPYCLYQEAEGATHKWGYPKLKIFNNSSVVMVQDTSLWSGACTEPPNIETWHSSFFILLSISNILQIILCLSQIVNGIIGALCGHCDQKK